MSITGAKRHQVHPYAAPPPERDDFEEFCSELEALKSQRKPGRL